MASNQYYKTDFSLGRNTDVTAGAQRALGSIADMMMLRQDASDKRKDRTAKEKEAAYKKTQDVLRQDNWQKNYDQSDAQNTYTKEMDVISAKLANEKFISKAPEKVVNAEREKLVNIRQNLKKVRNNFNNLQKND